MTEEINEMINKFCDSVEKRINQYDLETELQRLKQENKELKEETLQWKQIKDMANNNKYRSALEEIKRYAEEIADTNNMLNCGYNASRGKKILKKINEVL